MTLEIKKLLYLSMFLMVAPITQGQIVINEFSAANSSIIEDSEYNDYSDWIELYNSGSQDINLRGYYLSDNISNPDKWTFADDVIIEAKQYLLIWADGNNTGIHTEFKLSASGEELILSAPNFTVIDSISYGVQKTNISFGRNIENTNEWGYFIEPTPGDANNTTFYAEIIHYNPVFSMRGGLYSSGFSVEINSISDAIIRYTTDGSEPQNSDALYTQPISIDSTTILRARLFKSGFVPSDVATQSYFINENSDWSNLPVVSIASNPENFWDAEQGIYVQDFKPTWEIPINIEFFANNGSDRAEFNELAGCKVNGLWSWQLPQKMLGVYFKKQYGEGNLEYSLFSQRERSSFKSFALRASGSDWSYTLFRDILGQHSTLYNMDIDIMSFKPVIVFVNGQYMGIHNMREKVDDDYIEKSYGLESGTFDLVENEDFAEAGNLAAYNELSGLLDKDLSIQGNFDAVAELMDIENFTDFIITELAVANTSIDHNIMAWKPKEGGKWRWVLMDLDRGFFKPTERPISYYVGKDVIPLQELLTNDGYKDYFGRRMSDHLFTSFHPERMKDLIDEHKLLIESEIPNHVDRWLGTTSSYGNAMPSVDYWYNKVQDLIDYVEARPIALLEDLQNYGFSDYSTLSVGAIPNNAGMFYLNGLKLHSDQVSGVYLNNVDIELMAQNKPGYNFIGWREAEQEDIVAKESEWKYFDQGNVNAVDWMNLDFDDSAWEAGNAELGYGDDDENTVVDYGPSSANKYTTTYFRKQFSCSLEDIEASSYYINLMKDDGAVVYLNGTEILRSNMPEGEVTYETFAASSVSGASESAFVSYKITDSLLVEGNNVLAVEVHQVSAGSSDISFDLSLTGSFFGNNFISEDPQFSFQMQSNVELQAVFESTGECIIPAIIDADFTLNEACSPYLVQDNVVIEEGAKLIIEEGVEVWLPGNAQIVVNGAINAMGSNEKGIVFKTNPTMSVEQWGIINFKHTSDTSFLNYVTLEGASKGSDPVTETGAISAFYADVVMDNVTLLNNFANPIAARFSNIKLTNSTLHSDVTGDLINVKYGNAFINNCSFIGNDQPDTDAIDYDDVQDGFIGSCTIVNFRGFNSDAVDIGEQAKDILIDSLWVSSVTDKGVSVGQQSSVTIQNSVFVKCNLGIAVKDSSWAVVNQSVFYGNGNALACFEKNIGRAGGNMLVSNTILSNSFQGSVLVDDKSYFNASYSLADDNGLAQESGSNNLSANPLFVNPTIFDFSLLEDSPAIGAGNKQGESINMGTEHPNFSWEPDVIMVALYLNPLNIEHAEFITLYNPSEEAIDLSNYAINKGVTLLIPEGTILQPFDTLYLTNKAYADTWWQQNKQVVQWSEGQLSNEGEAIQLEDAHGIVVDYIDYNEAEWPNAAFVGNNVMVLKNNNLDNHFANNWETLSYDEVINVDSSFDTNVLVVYPNPANGIFKIGGLLEKPKGATVTNAMGQQVAVFNFTSENKAEINIQSFPSGIYYIKIEERTVKVIKME